MWSPFTGSISYTSLRLCWLTVYEVYGDILQRWIPTRDRPRIFFRLEKSFLSLLQDAESVWTITSVYLSQNSPGSSYLPILLCFSKKKVYFALAYRYNLCGLRTLWGQRKDPQYQSYLWNILARFSTVCTPFFADLIFHPSDQSCFQDLKIFVC